MAGVIKSLKVTWDWTGDIYALKGFNVAITPEGSNPNEVTTAISRAGKNAFEHTFKDLVLEEGNYTAWVQAIYENIDSDWESAGGITVEDDGTATITTYDQHKTLLDETASYRTPGPPSNNPVPTNISTRDNENGTLDITLEWAAYEQGERQADMIFLFYKKGDNKNLGAPTENDNAIIFNVNTGSASKHTIEGVAPNKYYSFGLAAGRRTENGIEIGKIQSPYSWQNVTIGSATINHDSVWATAGRGSVLINDSGLIGKKADGTITFQIDTDGEAYFSGKLIVGGEVANISDLETQAGAQVKADRARNDAIQYADEIIRSNVKIKPKGAHLWHFNKHLTSTDGIVAKII